MAILTRLQQKKMEYKPDCGGFFYLEGLIL